MKVRLLLAAICIFTLPMWFSLDSNKATMNSAPVATVALAGHIRPTGAFCKCGSFADCVCDEGETSVQNSPPSNKFSTTGNAEVPTGLDPSTSMMLIALALLLGLRMRL
ncbi:MAG TPA: hypothetical protein VLR90_09975 [Blastocatellia bacterium]|nr:hypothetical protein [Blastocatellia bacterium]